MRRKHLWRATLVVVVGLGMGRSWWLDRTQLELLHEKLAAAELRAEDVELRNDWLREKLRLAMKAAQQQPPSSAGQP